MQCNMWKEFYAGPADGKYIILVTAITTGNVSITSIINLIEISQSETKSFTSTYTVYIECKQCRLFKIFALGMPPLMTKHTQNIINCAF